MRPVTFSDTLTHMRPPTYAPDMPAPKKNRVVRVEDPTWDAAMRRADAEGVKLSEIVRGWLREYARGGTPKP
jgi:hypothetical protein